MSVVFISDSTRKCSGQMEGMPNDAESAHLLIPEKKAGVKCYIC